MFHVLYEDRRLIALDKPSGLLAVPGRGPLLADCLSARVAVARPGALVVHRLDRDTSGVLLMALDPAAQRMLSAQFAERRALKRYVAVVQGVPGADDGMVDEPLAKDFAAPPRHRVDRVHGRASCTRWRLVRRLADRAWLEVEPETGRSHQIRVHLAHLGHPILGDNLYAPPAALAAAPRLLLHAALLTVLHPDDGRVLTLECPVPF